MDLKEISLEQLREVVATVSQKPFLFNDTIEKNIELGRSSYTQSNLENALKNANAWEFVSAMPSGINQTVGEKGDRLSGGQLQRLALARAFFRNSPILVLDEATSALDAENEEKIHQVMKKLIQDKTAIIIAHRFSSIRLAQRIIVFEKGKIIADAKHCEIYENCPVYKKLYDTQLQES